MRRFRFALPEKKMVIGLPIGSHITIAAKDTAGKDVMRPYTPVTDDNSKGYVDFVIKASPSPELLLLSRCCQDVGVVSMMFLYKGFSCCLRLLWPAGCWSSREVKLA